MKVKYDSVLEIVMTVEALVACDEESVDDVLSLYDMADKLVRALVDAGAIEDGEALMDAISYQVGGVTQNVANALGFNECDDAAQAYLYALYATKNDEALDALKEAVKLREDGEFWAEALESVESAREEIAEKVRELEGGRPFQIVE